MSHLCTPRVRVYVCICSTLAVALDFLIAGRQSWLDQLTRARRVALSTASGSVPVSVQREGGGGSGGTVSDVAGLLATLGSAYCSLLPRLAPSEALQLLHSFAALSYNPGRDEAGLQVCNLMMFYTMVAGAVFLLYTPPCP
jgi:hypothetical protein